MADRTPFSFEFDPCADGRDASGFSFGSMGAASAPADADVLFPDARPRNQYEVPDPNAAASVEGMKQDSEEYRARPAEERLHELFAYMKPHRLALLSILREASAPLAAAAAEEAVQASCGRKFNVYSAANLCCMLEAAGGLKRVTADGTPYEDVLIEPEIVMVDGEEFYRPSSAPAICWIATEAGCAAVEANDPLGRIAQVFESEPNLLPIYKQVLLAVRGGAGISELSAQVDANPAIAEPRRFFVQHFVETLETCEAVAWDGSRWMITGVGEELLGGLLADTEAAVAFTGGAAVPDEGNRVVAETQGVNW